MTSTLVTASLEAISLQCVPYISYPVQFQSEEVRALIDFGNKVNAMTPTYASKLGFWVYFTDVGAQKIDGSTLKMFEMVLANF